MLGILEPGIVEQAEYALNELKKLSDSTIYSTLSIHKIIDYQNVSGVYYNNLIINLELQSQFFKNKQDIQEFEMIVMTHKTDGVVSIAINEFPEMDEIAIETFLVKKIENKRKKNAEMFKLLQLEDILLQNQSFNVPDEIYSSFDDKDVSSLLQHFETEEINSYRMKLTESLMPKLPLDKQEEEYDLNKLTMFQLYEITLNNIDGASDYKVYRSKKILNAIFNYVYKHRNELDLDFGSD